MESIDFKTTNYFQYIYLISLPEGKGIILVNFDLKINYKFIYTLKFLNFFDSG